MPGAGTRRTLGWVAASGGLGLVLAFGCAAQHQVTQVSPGVYRADCRDSLARCLVGVQDVCRAHGYDVLSASEKRDYVEQEPQGYESVKATATVRCREAVPMFGSDPNVTVPVASASAVASSQPAPSVVPPAAPAPAAESMAPSTPPAVPASPPAAPAPSIDGGAP